MKWFIYSFGLLSLVRVSYGSLADQMAETTQLCCSQGINYGRNHTSEDCSSSVPPDVPPGLGTLCIFAMDQCCKEYFDKKRDCESGIDIATSTNNCLNTKNTTKRCCDQCSRGAAMGSTRGAEVCSMSPQGNSAEQLLAGDAYMQCCRTAARDVKQRNEPPSQPDHSVTVSRKPPESKPYSVCEEFAPNELCAHHCIPIPGSYKCECNPGFRLMADKRNCMEITKNRCKPHNPCQHKCNDNGVEVKCSCRRGYHLMEDGKSCGDIDECLMDPPVCLPNTQCHNVQGSYKCIPQKNPANTEKGQCPPGFSRNLKNNVCDDVNECKLPKPPCPPYLCENTIGGYKCGGVPGDPTNLVKKQMPPVEDRCPPGFRSTIDEDCEDIDECAVNRDDCNKLSQFCINTRGSFYCQDKVSKHCPPGFKTNPYSNKCEDINECEDGENICTPEQICVNVPGEYDCKTKPIESGVSKKTKCPDGMRMDLERGFCVDIDECAEGTHLCDQYQQCLNTNGSHECRCKVGFEQDPTTGACVDINECATDQNDCIAESQRCDNTVGSYLCIRFISCGTGYILHYSTSTCEDVDECAIGTHNCDRAGPEYHCVNIPGSFRCQRKTTTTTLPPDYYYYDSEEEIEENETLSQNTSKASVAPVTSSSIPTTITEATTPSTKLTEAAPKITEKIPEEQPVSVPDDIDNNIINPYNRPEPAFPSERNPIPRQNFSSQSINSIQIHEPTPPYYQQRPEPYPRVTETTYSPLTESNTVATSPKLVNVNVGEETATVRGERNRDSSVIVNTQNIPNNEWTKVSEKPACEPGFELGSFGECIDIDECATNRHVCSVISEVCRNTMGGYVCDCAFGFRRDLYTGVCSIVSKSSTSSSTSTTTSTTAVSTPPATVTTPSSTTPPPTTTPTTLPPTTPPTLPPSSTTPPPTTPPTTPVPSTSPTMRSLFWDYSVDRRVSNRTFRPRSSCDAGFYRNVKTGHCDDVNECLNGQANCATGEICVNTDGGYRCDCPPNWQLSPTGQRCVPVGDNRRFPSGYENERPYQSYPYDQGRDEGRTFVSPDIPPEQEATSSCPWGYRLGIDNTCEDIDECSTGVAKCGPIQQCSNLPGGYTCSCPSGYRLVGDHQCEDVDECAAGGVPACSHNADCVNTIGSYQCRCHSGFKSAPINDKVCVDLDECSDSRPGTLCQQRCNNVWGGYRCSCHRGYRLNPDNSTCSDIDECASIHKAKLCNGRCINEPGSYRCSCPAGYRLSVDNKSCIDIDECETGEATCAKGSQYGDTSEVCLNTRGGYRCQRITCPAGYHLESKHRCTKIETVCSPTDWECAHQPTTISYNFITFVSNLEIPESQPVKLFTMVGPKWPYAKMNFQLKLVEVNAPPHVAKADFSVFSLQQINNQAVTSLLQPLEGPQSIELEMSMELYNKDLFGGIAVARLYIYVSEYEF